MAGNPPHGPPMVCLWSCPTDFWEQSSALITVDALYILLNIAWDGTMEGWGPAPESSTFGTKKMHKIQPKYENNCPKQQYLYLEYIYLYNICMHVSIYIYINLSVYLAFQPCCINHPASLHLPLRTCAVVAAIPRGTGAGALARPAVEAG